MLSLEVEYLTGVCFAARSQSSDEPDFPPQPDRVFSALVAAWGSRGEAPREKKALEWLEEQEPPRIDAPDHFVRRVKISYVPPNDMSNKPETMPDRRRRQARMFPAAIPHRPLVRFVWSAHPAEESFEALQALARDTAYLGHSASLVRCRFTLDSQADDELSRRDTNRRVYPGRFEELRRVFKKGERPGPGEPVRTSPEPPAHPAQSIFSPDWIILEDSAGQCPDLRGFAIAARRVRDALMSLYRDDGLILPEIISGHKPDGSPSDRPHMAIVPLADVGQTRYSEGRLMGLAMVLPRELDEERRNAERDWLAGIADASGKIERWRNFDRIVNRLTELKLGNLGVWNLTRTLSPAKKALQPDRYCRAANRWSTVTPIVLDRFPKSKTPQEREAEIASIISSACLNIGLPEPLRVTLYKHSAVKGAPSAYPSGNAPKWTGWSLPRFLEGRLLTHAAVEFSEAVEGPMLLGAGRFIGLGMCLGVRE